MIDRVLLPEEIMETSAMSASIVGRRRRFMVGEPLRVRIASTDEQLGRLELELR